jgi:pimeloyl-ACP methyl ester carboxylesterase
MTAATLADSRAYSGAMVLPHDELGSGPAVVLLHAGIADRRMWTEHLEPLAAAGRRAVAVDLPGFGDAALQPGLQAPWLDVLETMDALAVDRAALVGCSFGGAVALVTAVTARERVSALVLASAPAPDIKPSNRLRAAWDAEETALERDDVDGAVEAVLHAWLAPDAPAQLRERVGAMQHRVFELQADPPEMSDAVDPLDEDPGLIESLELPALCLAGRDDMPDFVTSARRLSEALPRGRYQQIDNARHLIPLEAPEAFRAALIDFLAASA